MKKKEALEELVCEVRNELLQEQGVNLDDAEFSSTETKYPTNTEQEFLLSSCIDNTRRLYSKLVKNGFNPKICIGGITDVSGELPSTESEAEDKGLIHHWIESGEFICEVSTESTESMGSVLVTKEIPPNYTVFRKTQSI